ncbi:MAG: helix-turn-helix domain-containing protein [Enterobacteriaceae bacterium]|jgi:transcriptional regulator with XRE-family HTH domain|nr:helix-turn-helix domain-containing protein [Enterobacteriaceae bacterium]
MTKLKSFRVERALMKLGADIRDARKRRQIKTEIMAERLGVTRATYARLEKGDPSVSMGSYALALNVLGKLDVLENIIDRSVDILGQDMIDARLPQRIR